MKTEADLLLDAHIALQAHQYKVSLEYLAKLAPEHLSPHEQARYFAIQGEAQVNLGQNDQAILALQKAQEIYEALPKTPKIDIGRVRNWLGLAYYNQGNHEKAIALHYICLEDVLSGEIKHQQFHMNIRANLGNELNRVGRIKQALEMYKIALSLTDPTEDVIARGGIYWGLAYVYRQLKDSTMAKLSFYNSLNCYMEAQRLDLAVSVRGLLAMVLVDRSEFEEALVLFTENLERAKELNSLEGLINNYNNLAYLYEKQGNFEEARLNGEKALQFAQKQGNKDVLAQVLYSLANVEAKLEAYERSDQLFKEALAILRSTDEKVYLHKGLFLYGEMLEKTKRLEEAIAVIKEAYNIVIEL